MINPKQSTEGEEQVDCDKNCKDCKPLHVMMRDFFERRGDKFSGWDWFAFSRVEMKENVDEQTKAIMKGFFQVFGIEILRDKEKGREVLGVKVTIFGDAIVASEDLSDLELQEANDFARATELTAAIQRCMGAAVARFAQENIVKYTSTFWKRHIENYGDKREFDSDVPF